MLLAPLLAHETQCGDIILLKFFIFGILLGIGVSAGALYALPAVDQHREVSVISVAPNGGNRESFHINIPMDRIMAGTAGQVSGIPDGIKWPQDDILSGVGVELFKVRNEHDVVIGVAARTVAAEQDLDVIDWVVHLPARGSLFINMDSAAQEDGYRAGRLRSGSQEFSSFVGSVLEHWIADTAGEEDAPAGRIDLLATYAATNGWRE